MTLRKQFALLISLLLFSVPTQAEELGIYLPPAMFKDGHSQKKIVVPKKYVRSHNILTAPQDIEPANGRAPLKGLAQYSGDIMPPALSKENIPPPSVIHTNRIIADIDYGEVLDLMQIEEIDAEDIMGQLEQ